MIAANAFRSISGRQSALLAVSQEVYCLVPDDLGTPEVHSRWERYDTSQFKLLLRRFETVVNNMGDRAPELARFANRASQRYPSIDHLFDTRTIDHLPAILLKRPLLWPAGGPLWCFLAFEPTYPENIEQQLPLVRDGRGIFAADDLTNEDHQSLAEAIAQMYIETW